MRLRISGDRYRLDEHWGEWSFTNVVTGATGFSIGNSGNAEDLHATAVRDFERRMLRDPILLLRARSRPVSRRPPSRSKAAASSPGSRSPCRARRPILGIEPNSGQVREARYRGRGAELWYGAVVDRYGDFRDVGGASIPHRVEVTFDGKARPEQSRSYETITIGGKIEDSVFDRPASGE